MQIIDSIIGAPARDLEIVLSASREMDLPVWLVGGPVRDALLGRNVRDLDFLVEERVEEIAEAVATRLGGTVRMHPAFMTAKAVDPSGRSIDFTTARTESYPFPGSLPVVQRASAPEDLLRRDFTMNAIACDLQESKILDPSGGRTDIERGVIRILHDDSFADDPTRIFRALRLGARLNFEIESKTVERLREALHANALSTVSSPRIWREIVLCMHESQPVAAFRALLQHAVLQSWLSATAVDGALGSRLANLSVVVDEIPALDREVLYLATLLSGLKNASIPGGLPFSRRRFALLESLLIDADSWFESWMEAGTARERAHLCLKLGPEELAAVALRHDEPAAVLRTCREVRATRLPFGGEDLEVSPGPHVGKALEETLIEAWLNGGTPEELLSFARRSALRYLNEQQS